MERKRLVILGTGFGACTLLRNINLKGYDVTLISPRNHFLFTPLLPSTTVGTTEFRSIIEPIRRIRKGVHYLQSSAESIDRENRTVACRFADGQTDFQVPYDYLVLSVGARTNTFRVPGVEEHTLFLKDLADARAIRQNLIANFERASLPNLSDAERARLLHFVVVGGGPTGVEFAAELHDFLEDDLTRAFPVLAKQVRITLVDALDEILSSFAQELREYAKKLFEREDITVRTKSIVSRVEEGRIVLKDGAEIECGMIVWCTGNSPIPLIESLPFEKDRTGRLLTDEHLRVLGEERLFAVGDCSNQKNLDLPPTAQVAQQEGKHLSRVLNQMARGREPKPFQYRHMGMLAYIGERRALADLPKYEGAGFGTWVFWRSAYLTKLVSMKNKVLVLFDWFRTFLFGRDISRF